jgi:alpha-tubulin suppressor-like RCC1 family protein
VSAGGEHALALSDTGEVWAWGNNTSGELGDGTTRGSILPVRVIGLTGVTLIAAGGGHSLAYRGSDGSIWAWGSNSSGQLGQPIAVRRSLSPVAITGLPALQGIATGGFHSLALATDGTVYAWGSNTEGQLGLGDFTDRAAPAAVTIPDLALAIGAGATHSLAVVGATREVWAWGSNTWGQLGSGLQGKPGEGVANPQPAIGIRGADQVAGGDIHSIARTTDGRVWGWGYNTEGQVGNGDLTPPNVGILRPTLLTGITGVSAIDAGGQSSIAEKPDGSVWMWGSNQLGTCGVNGRVDPRVPTQVVNLPGAVAISVGGKFAMALAPPRSTSGVLVVGDPRADTSTPVPRPSVHPAAGLTDVAMLAAGWHHALALDAQHRIWAWGDNTSGQIGLPGAPGDAPALVDVPLEGAAGFVQVVARANQSFALRSDGAVFAWGDNTYGQLGTGDTTSLGTPTRVSGLTDVLLLAAGERHGLAMDRSGAAWSWGQNLHGELGTRKSATLVPTPELVPSFYSMTEVAAGGYHSLAIDSTGALYAWGSGTSAQLGTGGLGDSHTPVLVDIGHVASVSAGRFHSTAVLEGGAVWAFGDSWSAQLGDGAIRGATWSATRTRVAAPALLSVAGDYHSVALGYDGAVYAWGDDSRGQLGLAGPDAAYLVYRPLASSAPPGVLAAGGLTFTVLAVK